jgi:uridine kinase
MSVLTIGIAGGSGSGKTTVVKKIMACLPTDSVCVISQDAYYYDNSKLLPEERKKINFDHPQAIEFELLCNHLRMLQTGFAIEQPQYSFIDCARLPQTTTTFPRQVIVVEGILIFAFPQLLSMLDLKFFVDTEADERLSRIIRRDTKLRGRDTEAVITRYFEMVKPMHEQFIEPTKLKADLIIPHGGENTVAIQALCDIILKRMQL